MSTSTPVRLRIFSLNCWGIRYLSKHCVQRFAMIRDHLNREQHDLVLLQEIWCEKDYLFLKRELGNTYRYSHYFKSGVIGSGLAVFSTHKIHDAFLYRYSLNGYPYMAHHGDWFGGKAVGKVLLNISGMNVHVYVTHLHAEYCRKCDSYLPHRVVQSWELQQFIRHTSEGADVVVFGGDLNMHPEDLGNRLLRTYTGLKDCFTETEKFDGCEGGLTHIIDNPFTNKQDLARFGRGIRIDYILFKGSERVDVKCESLSTTTGTAAGHPFPLSDHEAVSAELQLCVRKMPSREEDKHNSSATDQLPDLINIITEARTEVKVGVHCAERMRYTAARTGAMGLALLLLELAIAAVPCFSLGTDQPFPKASFYLLGVLCFTILLSTTLLYVFYSIEVKALQGAEDQMRLAMSSLQERLKECPRSISQDLKRKEPDSQDLRSPDPDA
ncbi:sphingomyelin phosphodiesterase 2 [Chanos chanos]|uniref:sphingomyelin phosphodiesterase n=1 Tax=Chanos chanos TaxID=29144 RepID=A0A6J2VMY6_CHACN|nr:sphingomyelin phosphodiesterase 2-like [Chanos chanos]XP_030633219.1 sphingomyelin phosphodiesterase 2-like [Chanos chanos]XP_030633220.1 sphingomyelin phosphodiesterase 2-like [Chanos chanos]XP_030633222.1 sphingomyelin phosphodiesterase 2-like [Chanos chanos]